MKTKAQIVQELLEAKKITAEEAVVLLMGESKQVEYIPYPVTPIQPVPYWGGSYRWYYNPTTAGDNITATHTSGYSNVTLN